ncbi:MAG TPA: hypothetical protein VM120_01520, partial [Bryobacteraceae bacterium]|nr:hypothetical protein [Bryobacteraceae bacterium]
MLERKMNTKPKIRPTVDAVEIYEFCSSIHADRTRLLREITEHAASVSPEQRAREQAHVQYLTAAANLELLVLQRVGRYIRGLDPEAVIDPFAQE